MVINVLPCGRRDEGCDDKVDVGEEEEYCYREGSAEGWCPLLGVSVDGERVEVQMDQGTGYKDVDYC